MKKTSFNMTSRILFRLLPIQVLLVSIGSINGIVSSLFASNSVGVIAMSAVGLYSPINMLVTAFGTMLVSGSTILCGKYMGRNQSEKVQNLFYLCNIAAIILAAVFTSLLLIIGLFDLTGFLTQDPLIRPLVNQYITGQAIGIFPLILGSVYASFLSLENKSRRTMAASITYILVNVLANFVFVQLLKMEALGLALASSVGLWVFFLIQAQYFFTRRASIRRSESTSVRKEIGEIIRIGIPGAANSGYQAIRGLIVNMLLAAYVGSAGLSAFATANTLLGLVWAIPTGMLNVSRMMISISVGEEDRQTLTDTMRNAVYRFIPLMCVICALVMALAVPLTSLYYQDTSAPVFSMTVWGFRILPLCMPLAIFRMHFSCYDQTVDRNVLVNVLEAVDGFITLCLLALVMIPLFLINGLYWANVLNGVISILVLLVYAVIKNRRMPRNMEELMVIPPGFGVDEEERIDLSIRNMEGVINISRKVQAFCLEKGIDARRAYIAALFIEEMAGNVVSHGFHKDSRPHSVDIRVTHKDDNVILRIKDDCIPFNPADRKEMLDPDDLCKNIGIRMMYHITDDITYQNLLGMNALTLKL